MKGRKPILCVWLPNATQETIEGTRDGLNNKIADEYHVIVVSAARTQNPKIELLGTRKLSKRKYQTILSAMNK